MAKKRSNANQFKKTEISGKILPKIGIISGLTLIQKVWPELRVMRKGSDILRMQCPIHHDPNPSCDLNFITSKIHCYGCQFNTYNLFEFLQKGKGWSYKSALDTIRQYVDLKTISDATAKELHTVDIWQTAMAYLMEAFNEHLQRLLHPENRAEYTPSILEATSNTLHWLFKQRQRQADLVHLLPYGVVPTPKIIEILLRELSEKEVDRRSAKGLQYPEKDWREEVYNQALNIYKTINPSFIHCVSYHNGYSFTVPGLIKVRRPQDGKAGNIEVFGKRQEDDPLGFFGLYRPNLIGRGDLDANRYHFLMAEGENDALAFMEGLELAGKTSIIALGAGGNANETDLLKEAQINELWLIGDEPGAGGNDFIKHRLSTAYEVDIRVFSNWNKVLKSYPTVKDPDELILEAGFQYAYDTFIDTPENYMLTADWVYQQVQEKLAIKEIEEGNLRPILDQVTQYGACVRYPSTQARFITLMHELTKIPEGELRQCIVQSKGTEAAFKAQLVECLKREFLPLYVTPALRSPVLHMFHRVKRITVEFPVNDGEAIGLAIARIHGSFYEFIRERVGLPAFLNRGDDESPNVTPEKLVIKDLFEYAKLAMHEVLKGVPLQTDCDEWGQGGHILPDLTSPEREMVQYFNVGTHVYKGKHEGFNSTKVQWTELDGPADGAHLFRTTRHTWSTEIMSVADLAEGNNITKEQIANCIKTIEDMIRIGWKFAHQETDPTYLSYLVAAYTISYVWPYKTILSIHGDTHSGKSTLLSIFCGASHPALRLLESSVSIDVFSVPGVYQAHSRSSLLLCFDEFEEDGDNQRHSADVVGLIRLMRNVIGERGSSVVRGGTRSSPGPEYLIKTPIAFASIHQAKKAEDNNRRMDIETRKDANRRDPAQNIFQKYSVDDIKRIKRTLTLGLPKFAFEFRNYFEEVAKTINTKQLIPFKVPTRYLNNYIPVSAMMQLLNQKWEPFLLRACELRQTKLNAMAGETHASTLFDRLFGTANVHPSGDSKVTSRITDHLRSSGLVDDLNKSRCGVLVNWEQKYAVIDWITVQNKNGILEGFSEYRSKNHRNLKDTFDQHPAAIRTEEYVSLGVDRFVRSTGSNFKASTISVINITDLIEELKDESNKNLIPLKGIKTSKEEITHDNHANYDSNNI
jgi:hypothetical protein